MLMNALSVVYVAGNHENYAQKLLTDDNTPAVCHTDKIRALVTKLNEQLAKEFRSAGAATAIAATAEPELDVAEPHSDDGGEAGAESNCEADEKADKHGSRASRLMPQIHFLENDQVVIGGVRFVGCTLWTDFALLAPALAHNSAVDSKADSKSDSDSDSTADAVVVGEIVQKSKDAAAKVMSDYKQIKV